MPRNTSRLELVPGFFKFWREPVPLRSKTLCPATGSGSSPAPDKASARWVSENSTLRAAGSGLSRRAIGRRCGGAGVGLPAVSEKKRTPPPAEVSEEPSLRR